MLAIRIEFPLQIGEGGRDASPKVAMASGAYSGAILKARADIQESDLPIISFQQLLLFFCCLEKSPSAIWDRGFVFGLSGAGKIPF